MIEDWIASLSGDKQKNVKQTKHSEQLFPFGKDLLVLNPLTTGHQFSRRGLSAAVGWHCSESYLGLISEQSSCTHGVWSQFKTKEGHCHLAMVPET